MSESRWIIQVEKTCENKLILRYGGRLQVALKPIHGALFVSGLAALIKFVWPLWH